MKPNSRQLSCSRLLRGVLQIDHGGPSTTIPLHLCPAAARACATLSLARTRRNPSTTTATAPSPPSQSLLKLRQARNVHGESVEARDDEAAAKLVPLRQLPLQCNGCGAFSQTSLPDVAGYYDTGRNSIKDYLGIQDKVDPRKYPKHKAQSDVVRASLQSLGEDKLAELGLDPQSLLLGSPQVEGLGSCKFSKRASIIYVTDNSQQSVLKSLSAIDATTWSITTKANQFSTHR